jgi:hypothetical protein
MRDPEQLGQAARDPSVQVRYRVARHKTTSSETVHQLCSDPDKDVRYACAVHPALNGDDLEWLASQTDDISGGLLARLAERKNITDLAVQHILGHLDRYYRLPDAGQPDPYSTGFWADVTASELAGNPALSARSLQLTVDLVRRHRLLRPAAMLVDAQHPEMTPQQQIQVADLIGELYPLGGDISCRWRQQLPAQAVTQLYRRLLAPELLGHPGISWDQALELYGAGHIDGALACLVGRPDCPVQFMRQVDCGAYSAAVFAMARNPKCPPDILETLAAHPDSGARTQAAQRVRDPQVLRRLAGDPDVPVRCNVAANRRTPPDTVAQLLRDDSPTVRNAAAANPHLPRATRAMWQLAQGAGQ